MDRFGKMTLMLLLCGAAFGPTAHAQNSGPGRTARFYLVPPNKTNGAQ